MSQASPSPEDGGENRLLQEIFLRLSRGMLQHEHIGEFETNPKLFYTAISDFFQQWSERQQQQQQFSASKEELRCVMTFSLSNLHPTLVSWSEDTPRTAEHIVRHSPLIPLDRVRREIRVAGAVPHFMESGLIEVVEVCRVLDDKWAVRTPPGVINAVHFLSTCCSLVPCEKMTELIPLVGGLLQETCHGQYEERLAYDVMGAVLLEWSVLDSYYRSELKTLSHHVEEEARSGAGKPLESLESFLSALLEKEDSVKALTSAPTDPKTAAVPPPRAASAAGQRPSVSLTVDNVAPDPEEAATESPQEEEEAESEVSVEEDIDYRFWSQLAS
ncbi:hypothetical protein AGDE_11185 [Angomonas deanei]|uniref:Uncharacterized protein n=1 Tax=Angomonas deanei TaxID=59799 RepID=A0A7G2CHB3_9TRYP|nr:hypothetical protein AGDE_11185 [Angomonas deanei]CAD2219146.1 hypothetical protein, conserved [Angomonas deanei]|eukprot:EPY26602.1 hypothetical protein AGDE_11185 [Angomonas deanei]